jgi:hypothetical protein
MSGHESLRRWYRLADELSAASSHAEVAEAARILDLNCAHYASRYGELPIEEHLDFLSTTELSDEQARLIASGIGNAGWGPRVAAQFGAVEGDLDGGEILLGLR